MGQTIEVFHNGRRLVQAPGADPRFGDYYVAESGGTGTGYDTVTFVSFSPTQRSVLTCNYLPA